MPSRISVTQGPQGAKGFRFAALISMQLFGTDWETLALGRVCYSYRRQRGSVERALRTRGTYGRPTAQAGKHSACSNTSALSAPRGVPSFISEKWGCEQNVCQLLRCQGRHKLRQATRVVQGHGFT